MTNELSTIAEPNRSQQRQALHDDASQRMKPAPVEEPFAGRISRFGSNAYLHVAILTTIILICYARTVTSYFLADDFGHIGYIHAMFKGHWNMFWCNFTGNFMGIDGIKVYRPAQIMCEMVDWMLFRANAAGWYAMNLAYFVSAVSCFYLVVRKLVARFGTTRSAGIAFFAATLFALNPLRCESISWMVGRIDIVTSLAYLLSVLFFLKPRTVLNTSLSVGFFALAMLLKEMPVGLPIVLAAIEFFGLRESAPSEKAFAPQGTASARSASLLSVHEFVTKSVSALRSSAPWWLALAVYFAIRRLALGTFGGGYAAGMGGGSLAEAMHRWLDPDTARRLLFPFNFAVMPEPNIYSGILTASYLVLFGLLVVRLILGAVPWRHFAFCGVWLLMCAVPIYQLWGIGYELEGGRFYYFLCMPLSMLISLIALAPLGNTAQPTIDSERMQANLDETPLRRLALSGTVVGACVSLAIAFCFSRMAIATNAAWVNAGKEVRRFKDACIKAASSSNSPQIAVLSAPRRHAGAHQLLNGTTVQTLFHPPFTEAGLADRFISFEPVMFGPNGLINASRLREVAAKGVPIFVWSTAENKLRPLKSNIGGARAASDSPSAATEPITLFPSRNEAISGGATPAQVSLESVSHGQLSTDKGVLRLTQIKSDDCVAVRDVNVPASQYDFLELHARFKGGLKTREVRVAWTAPGQELTPDVVLKQSASEKVKTDDPTQTIVVNLSHRTQWHICSRIANLYVFPDVADSAEIIDIRLLPAPYAAPLLNVSDVDESAVGIHEVSNKSLLLKFEKRFVAGVDKLQLQVSKPNCFFDNFTKYGADDPVARTVDFVGTKTEAAIHDKLFKACFPAKGNYQLRLVCLDSAGNAVGAPSDEVTIKIK